MPRWSNGKATCKVLTEIQVQVLLRAPNFGEYYANPERWIDDPENVALASSPCRRNRRECRDLAGSISCVSALMSLNDKQTRFCEEYLVDLNSTQAAIRAGYSTATAHSTGWENLRKPEIAKRIQELQYERSQRTQVTADRVLIELARIGFSDIRKMFTDDDRMKPISGLCDDMAPAVSAIEVVTKTLPTSEGPAEVEYVHKVKLWDKNSALDKIAKHLGMMVDRVEHTGANGKDLIPTINVHLTTASDTPND